MIPIGKSSPNSIRFNEQNAFRFGLQTNAGNVTRVYFYAIHLHRLSIEIKSVCCVVGKRNVALVKKCGEHSSLLFQCDDQCFDTNKKIYYRVLIAGQSTATFRCGYQLTDDLCAKQLWAAAENRRQTDVELLVRDRAIPAHRAMLAGRSPVWERHFQSNPREKQVRVDDADDLDPAVFEHFLHWSAENGAVRAALAPGRKVWAANSTASLPAHVRHQQSSGTGTFGCSFDLRFTKLEPF